MGWPRRSRDGAGTPGDDRLPPQWCRSGDSQLGRNNETSEKGMFAGVGRGYVASMDSAEHDGGAMPTARGSMDIALAGVLTTSATAPCSPMRE